MNLWFRLIKILLLGYFAPRVKWDDPTQVNFRCWPTDLDINLHMTNSRYLALMDLARVNMMLRMGLWAWIRREGYAPVIASALVRFRRPVQPFEHVTLTTQFLGFDAKWMFIEHRMERNGELVSLTIVKAAFLGKSGPVAPQKIAETFGMKDTQKPLPEWITAWLAAEHAASQEGERR